MSDRSDRSAFVLGPGSNVVPFPASRMAGSSPRRVTRPTYWLLNSRRRVVVNPNTCEICHRGPHAETAHHAFTPDRLPEAQARAMGWPIPDTPHEQDPLL